MKKLFTIFIFFFCVSLFTFDVSPLFSQQPTQEWVQRFTWNNSVSGLSVKLDSAGNVYVLMKLYTDSTLNDFGLVKYGNSGNLIWSAHYNSPGNLSDAPAAFAVTPAGDVYITGNSGINFTSQMTTVKYNSGGTIIWVKTNNIAGSSDIKTDKQGNIIVVGGIADGSASDAYMVKYNTNGDTLFSRSFRRTSNGAGLNVVILDDSDNIYAVGSDAGDYLVLKYSASGNFAWYATYDSPQHYSDEGDYIAIDNNRNVYVIGTTYVIGSALNNTLVKLNTGGIIQWSRIFTGIIGGQGDCEFPGGLVLTPDGNSIYYSTECANSQGNSSMVLLKYNSLGDSVWIRQYAQGATGGIPTSSPALKLDKYNNIYVAGFAVFPSTSLDYVTIKYSPTGIQHWVITYNGPLPNSADGAADLSIDTSLNVYVTGTSSRQNIPQYIIDAATIKYSQPNEVEQISSSIPRKFKLGTNYPNPFNPNTKFKFEVPRLETVKIVIYDIIGREIATLVNDKLKPGIYEANWNAGNYSSGVYFYSILTETYRETKKAVLIK